MKRGLGTGGNCRSLALPNFLLIVVALIEYVRFSPTENRTRGGVSELRGRKFGCARDDKIKVGGSPEDSLVGSKGPGARGAPSSSYRCSDDTHKTSQSHPFILRRKIMAASLRTKSEDHQQSKDHTQLKCGEGPLVTQVSAQGKLDHHCRRSAQDAKLVHHPGKQAAHTAGRKLVQMRWNHAKRSLHAKLHHERSNGQHDNRRPEGPEWNGE